MSTGAGLLQINRVEISVGFPLSGVAAGRLIGTFWDKGNSSNQVSYSIPIEDITTGATLK